LFVFVDRIEDDAALKINTSVQIFFLIGKVEVVFEVCRRLISRTEFSFFQRLSAEDDASTFCCDAPGKDIRHTYLLTGCQ